MTHETNVASEPRKGRLLLWTIGAVGVVFGLMTLVAGGAVVFDIGTARAEHGHYVPFVLYFNFLSGFAYIAAGIGAALRQRWAAFLAVAIAAGIAVTSAALAIHVLGGGAYETETALAMVFRFLLWLGIAALLCSRRG